MGGRIYSVFFAPALTDSQKNSAPVGNAFLIKMGSWFEPASFGHGLPTGGPFRGCAGTGPFHSNGTSPRARRTPFARFAAGLSRDDDPPLGMTTALRKRNGALLGTGD